MPNLIEKAIQVATDIEKAEGRRDSVEKEIKQLQKRRDELQDSADKESRQLIADAKREANRIIHEASVMKESLDRRGRDIELKEKALASFPDQVEKLNRSIADAEKKSDRLADYASSLSAKEDALKVREQQISLHEKQLGIVPEQAKADSSKKDKPSKKR